MKIVHRLSALVLVASIVAAGVVHAASITQPGLPNSSAVKNATAKTTIPKAMTLRAAGTGQDTGTSCVDVACGTSSCICFTGNGSLTSTGTGFGNATYTYEVSCDTSAPLSNGAGGIFAGCAGFFNMTTPKGDVVDFDLQGFVGDTHNFNGMGGISGSFLVSSGTGSYSTAIGAGTFAIASPLTASAATVSMNGVFTK